MTKTVTHKAYVLSSPLKKFADSRTDVIVFGNGSSVLFPPEILAVTNIFHTRYWKGNYVKERET